MTDDTGDLNRDFGVEVKRRRRRKRLTQYDLADAVGVSRVAIAQYEAGRNSPTLFRIVAIARALGVRASTLIRCVDVKRTAQASRALRKRGE